MRNAQRAARRRGWTMIELIVALSVVILLLALILPAIQASREAARRTQCTAHLKQIGIALGSYTSAHQMFPMVKGCYFGPHVTLLPFLEQQNLYETFDWSLSNCHAATAAARPVEVPIYYCPSDPAPRRPGRANYAGTNYRGNAGSGVQKDGYNGIFRFSTSPRPLWSRCGPVHLGGRNDGLSNTAAFAEARRASGEYQRLTTVWQTPQALTAPHELDAFAAVCEGIPPDPRAYGWRGDPWSLGHPWTTGDMGFGLYTHILPPNRPSCQNSIDWQLSAMTAGSYHAGGANVLFADGRIQFIADAVDRKVWRGYGSWVENALVN